MILAQVADVSTPPVSPDLVALALIPLFGLAVISVLGLPVLLIAMWGRWRLLFAVLTPLTLASVVMTVFANRMRYEFGSAGEGLPTELEIGCYVGVGLSLGLLVTFAVVTLCALAEKRRWGVLACLVGAPIALVVLLLVNRASTLSKQTSPSASALIATPTRVVSAADPAAGLLSDNELLAVAAAEPSIPLDDNDQSEEPPQESPVAQGDDLPDWVDGEGSISTGPFVTADKCRVVGEFKFLGWLRHLVSEKCPDASIGAISSLGMPALVARFERENRLEKRTTSVGEVYLQHVLLEASEENVAWLAGQLAAQAAEARSSDAALTVAFSGGALLAVVGLLHFVLRGGETPTVSD